MQTYKGTAMKFDKALINNHLRVPKISWKFRIPTIYNFCNNLPVKFAIFLKSSLPYFLTVSIVFSVYKQNFTA